MHLPFPHETQTRDSPATRGYVKLSDLKLGVSPKSQTPSQELVDVPSMGDRSSKTSAAESQQSKAWRQIIYRFTQRFEKYGWRASPSTSQTSTVATSFRSQDLPSVGAEIPGLFSSSSLPPSLVPGHLAASFMSRAPAVAGALFLCGMRRRPDAKLQPGAVQEQVIDHRTNNACRAQVSHRATSHITDDELLRRGLSRGPAVCPQRSQPLRRK